jgi:hypothetical protein
MHTLTCRLQRRRHASAIQHTHACAYSAVSTPGSDICLKKGHPQSPFSLALAVGLLPPSLLFDSVRPPEMPIDAGEHTASFSAYSLCPMCPCYPWRLRGKLPACHTGGVVKQQNLKISLAAARTKVDAEQSGQWSRNWFLIRHHGILSNGNRDVIYPCLSFRRRRPPSQNSRA